MNRHILLLSTLLLAVPAAGAAERASDWLMRISDATRRLDYDGVFVYLRGGQLETVRIIHKVVNGQRRERLVSLTGSPREVIRNDHMVLCYLPDQASVVAEHRKVRSAGFPAVLPERLAIMERYYRIRLDGHGRVAGRHTRQVLIEPRDGLRYGYRLWADQSTGLLLRSDLLDPQGRLLEQFMFTHLVIGRGVSAADLVPQTKTRGYRWHREPLTPGEPLPPARWTVRPIPPGFHFTSRVYRRTPVRKAAVEHLVFSDGLATVSLFVEPVPERGATKGPSAMGAVHAYGRRLNGHQVTVVGEVPEETVRRFAGAVEPVKSGNAKP